MFRVWGNYTSMQKAGNASKLPDCSSSVEPWANSKAAASVQHELSVAMQRRRAVPSRFYHCRNSYHDNYHEYCIV